MVGKSTRRNHKFCPRFLKNVSQKLFKFMKMEMVKFDWRLGVVGTSANGTNCEQQDNRHEQHDEERCALVTFLRVPTLLQAFGQLLTFSFARTPVLGFLS